MRICSPRWRVDASNARGTGTKIADMRYVPGRRHRTRLYASVEIQGRTAMRYYRSLSDKI
jgi:hypothetical protein